MNKQKLALKIVAFIIAAGLIGMIVFITNSFTGNPISSAIAGKAINKYVAQQYSSLDLDVEKPRYNFKNGEYIAKAKSKTSVDTHFDVYYRGGKVQRDDYESYVLGKFNTLRRLEDEYSALVIPILSKVAGLEINTSMVTIEKLEEEKANENMKLDMKFDKTLPIEMKIIIRTDLKDNSLKNIASILENSHRTLLQNGCIFATYDIFSEYNGVLVMISDARPADIESGKLEQLLQDAKNYEDEESGKVVEKGDEKKPAVRRLRVDIKDNKEK